MSPAQTTRRVRGAHGDYTVVGEAINAGGVGSIFRTTDPKWVYKEYHSPEKAPPAEHLQRLVEIGRDVLIRQGQEIGSRPESSINWPVDIVRGSGGRIVGCVLPAIPDRYFHPTLNCVNTIEFLVMRRSKPPAATYRMVVLLRMAEILAFVHSKRLVHGDVNAKNVAWTLRPEPAAYLIDCDGMVPQDPPPVSGVQANYWTDPRVVDRVVPAQDHYSDWYCLALAFYRGLLLPAGGNLPKVNGKWAPPGQIPADLDPRIAALLRRGLTDPLDPSRRPEPAEWVSTLMAVYIVDGRYDDAALAKLDPVTFTPLPPTPPPPAPGPPAAPPPGMPPGMRPPPPAPPRMPPAQPVPPRFPPPRFPPQPTPPRFPPQPTPPRFPPHPSGKPAGTLATWAMDGGIRWYLPIGLMTLCLFPVAGILALIVLLQTLKVDHDRPGRTPAVVSSSVVLAICTAELLSAFS
ncbi:hypothetical protein GCM10010168_46510 [Actinoplanes ianthinogenes]|uniref:Protein kinase domain-containing protein n=1 Tax=Actinoplanes ianthinogenes TaxID=122358 RepID=A0ABM7LP79_9ACTN|nr:hypothetical protein [Actinoplanes ianthinogenes]BCJ41051.1 hypothetical protein Aiant_17080 [Actinoplanes ianthinogenes]GGR23237.1 hypothetical protein GCM10010168_46510 [Actinoplanes ianthinogenes]